MMPINKQRGFSLIEMIVSLGVFSIVITTAIGALLVVIGTNSQLQAEQSVMTNLAFAMDSMTREMRTGYNYYCEQKPNNSGSKNIFNDSSDHEDILASSTKDCKTGVNKDPITNANNKMQGVSFFEGGNSITGSTGRRIFYYYDKDEKKLFRRVGNGPSQSIVSSGLVITNAEFYVTGSDKLSASDTEQPTVTIYLEAKDTDSTDDKVYHLQTTVTQRTLDI